MPWEVAHNLIYTLIGTRLFDVILGRQLGIQVMFVQYWHYHDIVQCTSRSKSLFLCLLRGLSKVCSFLSPFIKYSSICQWPNSAL